MSNKPINVLFLCTGNSARSIIGEKIVGARSLGRLRGFSAGSNPTGRVNPFAIRVLRENGYDTDDLRSKNWSEFAGPDAPKMDYIFTVCDSAAAEACPVWPGQPATAHWGIPDPAAVIGDDATRMAAFRQALSSLEKRVAEFLRESDYANDR